MRISMSEIWSELVRHYGIVAVIVTVFFGATVWALAHIASAPGTLVKVLWGLVEYTKSTSRALQSSTEPTSSSSTIKGETTGSIAATAKAVDGDPEAIIALRSQHSLRALNPLESDRPYDASPPGSYFFVFSAYLDVDSQTWADLGELRGTASRLNSSPRRYFEFHHRSKDQFFLVAFTSETDADRIQGQAGNEKLLVTVAPRPWGPFSSIVELPVERVLASRGRNLEIEPLSGLAVLDLTVV